MLFYILSILVIACIIPYTDASLLGASASDVAISPFTVVFKRAGLAVAASVMNAVVLTSVISAANSGLYASTRMLYAMAKTGDAPKIFAKLNRHGIPIVALVVTVAVGLITFLTSIWGEPFYIFLIDSIGIAGLIAWLSIGLCHIRFRQALKVQNISLDKLIYKSKFYPIGSVLVVVLCTVIIFGQNIDCLITLDIIQIVKTYIVIFVAVVLLIVFKIGRKSKLVDLRKVDLSHLALKK